METYGLRLGPLRFVTALSDVAETLGDQLEQVGPSLVAGDRRPRPFNLEIPVRAAAGTADPYTVGMRMRRQVRQLMENTDWRLQGIPFSWDIDPDLACWLLVGGGDLTEINDGLTFGEFKLSLTDCYIAGREGSHRPGRRMDLGDRRTGLVARDTYGLIYSTDYSAVALPAKPLTSPDRVEAAINSAGLNPTPSSGVASPRGPSAYVASIMPATPGDVVSWRLNVSDYATPEISPNQEAFFADMVGGVRAWVQWGNTPAFTVAGDLEPDQYYQWERVLGPQVANRLPVIIDNDVVRIRWTGIDKDKGLVIERFYDTGYSDGVRICHPALTGFANDRRPQLLVRELTPERSVLEFDNGADRMRVILQRNWTGPRIEVPSAGATTSIEMTTVATGGSVATPDAGYPWIQELRTTGPVTQARVAASHSAVLTATSTFNHITPGIVRWYRADAGPVALQIALGRSSGPTKYQVPTVANLASASIVDARSVPVLVER